MAPEAPKMKDFYPEGIEGMTERVKDSEKIDLYDSARYIAALFTERSEEPIAVGHYQLEEIQKNLSNFLNNEGEVDISQEKYPNLYDAYHEIFLPLISSEKGSSFSADA